MFFSEYRSRLFGMNKADCYIFLDELIKYR